jgi:hypothetical protein
MQRIESGKPIYEELSPCYAVSHVELVFPEKNKPADTPKVRYCKKSAIQEREQDVIEWSRLGLVTDWHCSNEGEHRIVKDHNRKSAEEA